MSPFVERDFHHAEVKSLTAAAYSGFRHAVAAPFTQVDDNLFALELFHGPTLAFKDFAMQWLGAGDESGFATQRSPGDDHRATSGDTGAAAIEAFAEQSAGRSVHPLSARAGVGCPAPADDDGQWPNVHALAIEGSFDDCQRIVKDLFGDLAFRDEMHLSGVNSINWARILAQIVYYFVGAVALGAPERPVSFAVPTGNFGDVLAGYDAKRMGLPIERLIVATNENDILCARWRPERYAPKAVKATSRPRWTSRCPRTSSAFCSRRPAVTASGRAMMPTLAIDGDSQFRRPRSIAYAGISMLFG